MDSRFPAVKVALSSAAMNTKPFPKYRRALLGLAIVFWATLLLSIEGCSGAYSSSTPPPNNGVTVSPSTATIQVGGTQQFTAMIGGAASTNVKWTTNGGNVSTTGLYTAPGSTGTWSVTATSNADSTKSGSATVTVSNSAPTPTPTPGGITVTVSPSPVFVPVGGQQQFTATVTGTTNTGVTWTASAGSISSSGLFMAPSSSATVTVTATSMADTSHSGAATVTVAMQDPSVNSWTNRISGVNVPGGIASVLSSQSFDAFPTTNQQQYFQMYDASSITTDCTIAADGCSLKLAILSGYKQGEPGWFDWNFSPDLSKTFGNGQEFYVQYRERWDPGMLNGANFPNGEGIKHDIITEGDTTTKQAGDCSNSPGEVVTIQDGNGAGFPALYHNCGFSGGNLFFTQSPYQLIQLGGIAGSNFLDQDASGCPHYSGQGTPTTDPTCFNYVGNEWFTVQVHVKVGTFQTASSILEMWIAHQGQPAQLIVNASDAALVNDGSGGASGKYGKIQLSAYNTNMSGSLVNTAVWFDDLMVATRRIPDPNVTTPNAPDSLSLSGIAANTVTVNWRVNSHNGTAQDDTGFHVERCTGTTVTCFPNPQSGFSVIGTTAAGASSFVDTTAASGNTYTYRVRATNANGNSAYAAAICFNGGTTCGGTVTVP